MYGLTVTDVNGCTAFGGGYTVTNTVSTNDPVLAAHISVYPSPTNGPLFVRFDLPEYREAEIGVYDVLGRVLFFARPGAVQSDVLEFDLSDTATGLYLLKINVEGSWVCKVISFKK